MTKFKAFTDVFSGIQGELVKDDLSRFCCYNSSTLITVNSKVDPERMLMQEGRRQVFLYILSKMIAPQEQKPDNEDNIFDE